MGREYLPNYAHEVTLSKYHKGDGDIIPGDTHTAVGHSPMQSSNSVKA